MRRYREFAGLAENRNEAKAILDRALQIADSSKNETYAQENGGEHV
jgi:hypothetical protein